ncbi:MAG: hypothetical protein KGL39_58650 [Patescibacteria group bacterium]|nr:hypothetical protein [Patescibacteria group bacterium]
MLDMNNGIISSTTTASYGIGTMQYPYIQQYYYQTYPNYVTWTGVYPVNNSFEKAFKVASMLITEGIVEEMKLKKFIELVNKIEKEF